MQVRIKLPSGPLIHYLKFCRVIAEAVCPIDKDLEGIQCVLAKVYPPDVSTPNFGPGVPYPLEKADRKALASVLPKLPPLHHPMSEEKVALFMEAYVNMPKRPEWMPFLVTEKTILGRKIEHNQVIDRHIAAIREEHKAGLLVPVDTTYAPLETVQIGAYLTRKDAIAYLERHGLAYDDGGIAKSPEREAASSTAVGQKKLSPSDRKEIVKLHAKFKAEGIQNPTDRLAKEFDVSTSRIRSLIREAKAMQLSPLSLSRTFFAKRG